jgi:hypothetical protein
LGFSLTVSPGGHRRDKGRFTSGILPKYVRRAPSIDNLLPALYLKGISTGDFLEGLTATWVKEPVAAEECLLTTGHPAVQIQFSKALIFMGEAESNEGGDEHPSEKPGTLRGIILTAAFTLLGGIIGVLGKGCYDLAIEKQKSSAELQLEDKKVTAELNLEKEKFEENKRLERQKLDAELVKLALQASGINGAETLGFMVQTNLIEDSDIRKGVIAYLDSKKPVPRLQSVVKVGQNDTLLLRSGPGTRFSVIAEIPADANDISAFEKDAVKDGDTSWTPVEWHGLRGYVGSEYLLPVPH